VDYCIHEIISHRAQSIMSSPAIVSWDGEITFGEMESLSDRSAPRLRRSNVGPEVMVALMF
ncbi:hypothetical protein DL95DRAFT_240957, partial [Leptodontidium sp. 2 PMI_412]